MVLMCLGFFWSRLWELDLISSSTEDKKLLMSPSGNTARGGVGVNVLTNISFLILKQRTEKYKR